MKRVLVVLIGGLGVGPAAVFEHRLDPAVAGVPVQCESEPFASLRRNLNVSDGYPQKAFVYQLESLGVAYVVDKFIHPVVKLQSTTEMANKAVAWMLRKVDFVREFFSHHARRPAGAPADSNAPSALLGGESLSGIDDITGSTFLNWFKRAIESYNAQNAEKQSLRRRLSEVTYKHVLRVFDSTWRTLASHLPSETIRGFAQNTTGYEADAAIVDRFLKSEFTRGCLDSALGKAVIESVGANTTFSVVSPMVNMGQAICETSTYTLAGSDNTDTKEHAYNDICTLLNVARAGVACAANVAPPGDCKKIPSHDQRHLKCDNYYQDPTQGFVLDVHIRRPAREYLSRRQGNMDRWLFNGINMFYQYTSYDRPCGAKAGDFHFLPGWDTVGEVVLDYTDTMTAPQTKTMPIALILRSSKKPCDYVLMIRGTQAGHDWLLDFATEMVDLTVEGEPAADMMWAENIEPHAPLRDPRTVIRGQTVLGKAHKGFASLAHPIAKSMVKVVKGSCPKASNITVTGHSLGAGTAMVTSLLLSGMLTHHHRLGTVGFAAPMSLDQTGIDRLLDRVVMRTWMNEYDGVPKIPCAMNQKAGFVRCGDYNPATQSPKGYDYFAVTPHAYVVPHEPLLEWMPALNVTTFGSLGYDFSKLQILTDNLQLPVPLKFSQMHTCAYTCWLDAHYCHTRERALDVCSACAIAGK